jgi:hypothetical protein
LLMAVPRRFSTAGLRRAATMPGSSANRLGDQLGRGHREFRTGLPGVGLAFGHDRERESRRSSPPKRNWPPTFCDGSTKGRWSPGTTTADSQACTTSRSAMLNKGSPFPLRGCTGLNAANRSCQEALQG